MNPLIVPPQLHPGATIGVTAPSAGVGSEMRPRFDAAVNRTVRDGYQVRLGVCLFSDGPVSAPVQDRATELQSMMTEPGLGAVIPPWGGELLLPVLEQLDFDHLAAHPRWFAGWSDCSAVTLALLLRSGLMSLHGQNFMDLPMEPAQGSAKWSDVLALASGSSFEQRALTSFASQWPPYRTDPEVSAFNVDTPTQWKILGVERNVQVSGRLVGGCSEIVSRLIGTPFGDIGSFRQSSAPDGLIVYLENAESNAFEAARTLHQFRLAGWFDGANAILIGRAPAPDADGFTHDDAIADALGGLSIPVLYNIDIGHAPPQLLLVSGATATVRYGGTTGNSIVQQLM
jgi:muramoyltetrapeptide carboxypeptidase